MRRHFGFAGGELIGRADVHLEGSGSYEEGPVFWEVRVAAARSRSTSTPAWCACGGRRPAPTWAAPSTPASSSARTRRHRAGIGTALFEEVLFEGGVLATDSLLEYRVPTTHDLPDEMTCVIVENADGPGPFGAKGCGEGGLAAVAGALATALADAGVPMTTLPLTPERVWRRIRSPNSEEV